jgi:hypothetical protein
MLSFIEMLELDLKASLTEKLQGSKREGNSESNVN